MEELESLLAATGWRIFGRRCDDSVSLFLALCLLTCICSTRNPQTPSSAILAVFGREDAHARKYTWPISPGHTHVIVKQDVHEDLVPNRASAPDEAGDEGADLGDAAAEVRDGNVDEQENEGQDGEVDAAASKMTMRDGIGEKSSIMDEESS